MELLPWQENTEPSPPFVSRLLMMHTFLFISCRNQISTKLNWFSFFMFLSMCITPHPAFFLPQSINQLLVKQSVQELPGFLRCCIRLGFETQPWSNSPFSRVKELFFIYDKRTRPASVPGVYANYDWTLNITICAVKRSMGVTVKYSIVTELQSSGACVFSVHPSDSILVNKLFHAAASKSCRSFRALALVCFSSLVTSATEAVLLDVF